MADEEINEVRRIRHEISARFGHDISKLVAHYQGLGSWCKIIIPIAPVGLAIQRLEGTSVWI